MCTPSLSALFPCLYFSRVFPTFLIYRNTRNARLRSINRKRRHFPLQLRNVWSFCLGTPPVFSCSLQSIATPRCFTIFEPEGNSSVAHDFKQCYIFVIISIKFYELNNSIRGGFVPPFLPLTHVRERLIVIDLQKLIWLSLIPKNVFFRCFFQE